MGCSRPGFPSPAAQTGLQAARIRSQNPPECLLPWQVSKTGKELKEYIESMAGEDPLLKGVPEDKNPFKEKGGCTIS